MVASPSPIANFAVVNDGALWRGARPDRDGAQWLIDQGVETVINLEWEQDDDEVFVNLKGAPNLVRLLDFEPLPWFAPSVEDGHVHQFLHEMQIASKPVFVHCRSGQNRTGIMVAAYRLIVMQQPLIFVLNDFDGFKGFWAYFDSRYISSLYDRRAAFS